MKNRKCSSAWIGVVVQGGLVEHREVPEVEVHRPDRQRDERVGEEPEAVDRLQREHGPQHGPCQAGDEAERREVAEQHVLAHVDEEEVLLAELVDRRVERDHDERDPEPEEELPPSRHRQPAAREVPRPAQVEHRDDERRDELERLEVPGRGGGGEHHPKCGAVDSGRGRRLTERRATPAPASRSRSPTASSARLRAAVESTGATGIRGVRRAPSARRPAAPRRLDRRRRDEADAGAGARAAAPTAARDLAAHCINDVADDRRDAARCCSTTSPRTRSTSTQVAELVEGAAEVCRAAGVALVGGETAELPGIYRDGELDFAGTCVGIVDRDDLVDGSTRRGAGDAVIGFASAGVHANGFTLVRRMLEREDYDGPTCSRRPGSTSTRRGRSAAARRRSPTSPAAGSSATSAACSRTGSTPRSTGTPWERPPVFGWLARHVDEDELRRVFNLGIGWCAVVAEPGAGETVIGEDRVIGVLVCGYGSNLQALIDARPADRGRRVQPKDAYALIRARGAGIPTATFSLDCHAEPRGARPGHGDLARGARRRARRARRLHAPAHDARSSPASRGGS